MASLSDRKQYARKCLIDYKITGRAFDNCFENDDGDEVVKYLMAKAVEELPPLPDTGGAVTAEYWKLLKRHKNRQYLEAGIRRAGYWDAWTYFVKHGRYPSKAEAAQLILATANQTKE